MDWEKQNAIRVGKRAARKKSEEEAYARERRKRKYRPVFKKRDGTIKLWENQKGRKEKLKEEIESQKRAYYGTADGKPRK